MGRSRRVRLRHLTASGASRTSSARWRQPEADEGAAAVEFGLLVFPLFALVAGFIEFGIVFNAYISVSHGAHEAARLAAIDRTVTVTDVVNRVIATADPVVVDPAEVTPSPTLCTTTADAAVVEVSHEVETPLLRVVGIDTVTVSAKGQERC